MRSVGRSDPPVVRKTSPIVPTTIIAATSATMAHLLILARFWREGRPDLSILAMGCLMSLAAYLLSGVFLQLSFQRYFWILIALGNATIWVLRHERTNQQQASAA